MKSRRPLQGSVVLELGGREAAGVCGSLLSHLGATVTVVEPKAASRSRDACRPQLVAGKLSFAFDNDSASDRELVSRLIARSDVVLTSSDVDIPQLQVPTAHPDNIVCDLTAFGSTGPCAGLPFSEAQLQALSGMMDTTGPGNGPPVSIGVPLIGYATGTFAASAVLAAMRVKRRDGVGQRVEVAMFDTAFVSLNAFLTGVLTGQIDARTRVGNRHPTMAPWNLYPTADGWVLICTGNQGQWGRLCERMGRPELAGKYATQAERIANTEEIDQAIGAWTATLATSSCVDCLLAAGIPSGPIAPIDGFPREANLEQRGMIRKLRDPLGADHVFVPGSPLALRGSPPAQPAIIPAPGADRAEIERLAGELPLPPSDPAGPPAGLARPLAGIRVIEVGQYTTAPMCARYLAHLGAEVIKIEKPSGDESRTYPPFLGGRAETYVLNNADKRGIVVDLVDPAGIELLKSLLRTADVLVENNKPGTLARYGLTPQVLAGINPRLVHCAISGFGADSLYADRPGFDTVIQAMSGFMTAVHPEGEPYKSGASTADVMGAEMGILAILGALEHRDRTGQGQFIDLSMQDIACWLTAPAWNTDLKSIPRPALVRCKDGYAVAESTRAALDEALKQTSLTLAGLAAMPRQDAVARLAGCGLVASPVHSLKEAADWPQTRERGVWFTLPQGGVDWPALSCPMRLHLTPPTITRVAPELDQDGEAIRSEL